MAINIISDGGEDDAAVDRTTRDVEGIIVTTVTTDVPFEDYGINDDNGTFTFTAISDTEIELAWHFQPVAADGPYFASVYVTANDGDDQDVQNITVNVTEAPADITSNLLHWYTCKLANLADLGSAEQDGTVINGGTFDNGTFVMNGSPAMPKASFPTSYLIDSSNQLTISTRVKKGALSADFGAWWYHYGTTTTRIALHAGGSGFAGVNNVIAAVNNGADVPAFTTSNPFADGLEHLITMVFDGRLNDFHQRLLIYVDGALAPMTYTGNLPTTTPGLSASITTLGARSDNATPFIGTVRDIRIYGRALIAADVAALAAGSSSAGQLFFFRPKITHRR